MPAALELSVHRCASAAAILGASKQNLERVGTGALEPSVRGILTVSTGCGDVLCLGRYQLVPIPPASCTVQLLQRLSGGRAVPFGAGFVAINLILPHRSAMISDDPLALTAYQIPNRYIRPLLDALKSLGISASYPGRDLVLASGTVVGVTTFEVDERGALLFEVIFGLERDFSVLPAFLDACDPDGVVKAEFLDATSTSCVCGIVNRAVSLEDFVQRLCQGFTRHFGMSFTSAPAHTLPRQGAQPPVSSRQRLPLTAVTRTQLGVLEIHMALDACKRIAAIRFVGDFIANSPAIAAVERRLVGCSVDAAVVQSVLDHELSGPMNFILGVGSTQTLTNTICSAALS